jgi:hypothetical protein
MIDFIDQNRDDSIMMEIVQWEAYTVKKKKELEKNKSPFCLVFYIFKT